jgi:uncharacterized protein (TIGR02246 family)
MRRLIFLSLALPVLASAAPAPDAVSAVRAAFEHYDHGWRVYDVNEIIGVFAPDFEWTNSVGLRFTEKRKLTQFLINLFKNPNFRAGAPGPLIIRSVRLLAPDIAIISSSVVTDGQKAWNTGQTVTHQHTNELTVMQRRAGDWLIVSDLTSDESNGI